MVIRPGYIPNNTEQNWIDGQWVKAKSEKIVDVYNPVTGKVMCQIADSNEQDVDVAVQSARKAFEQGPWYQQMTAMQREKVLHKVAQLLIDYSDELANLESLDNGQQFEKHKGYIMSCSSIFEYYAGFATKVEGRTMALSNLPQQKYHSYTLREPYGVVAAITPWNAPLAMACIKLAPALAAGNCVVLKPPEIAPLASTRFGQILKEAGLPDGVVNIINGGGASTGNALSVHHDVQHLSFTGSTATGKKLIQNSATNMKRLVLEMGGKSPQIIFADVVDLQKAASTAAESLLAMTGQTCFAGTRLYVEEPICEKVLGIVKDIYKKTKVGPGPDGRINMENLAPLVSENQVKRVEGYIKSGLDDGAKLECGGSRPDKPGYFFEPTIFTGVKQDFKIFGPVMCITSFKSIDEVVEKANNTSYGLASGLFTSNIQKAHRIAAKLQAGRIWINCYSIADINIPLAGYKSSGWGQQLGEQGFDEYLQTKSIVCEL